MARLLLVADTHGSLKNRVDRWGLLTEQRADAILCLGDIYLNELEKLKEISEEKQIPIYGIHGNHEPMSFLEKTGIANLHAADCRIGDLRIAGLGGCPTYKENSGKLELCMLTDEQAMMIAKQLSPADILITHSPYKMKNPNVIHGGFQGITWYLKQHHPKWHFYGHLHNRDQKVHQFGLFHKTIVKSYCIYAAAIFDTDTEELEHLF